MLTLSTEYPLTDPEVLIPVRKLKAMALSTLFIAALSNINTHLSTCIHKEFNAANRLLLHDSEQYLLYVCYKLETMQYGIFSGSAPVILV